MTAKEFLRMELGEDLSEALGNKVAELMERYHKFKTEEDEDKNNERAEWSLV
jgi:hypothetical protein